MATLYFMQREFEGLCFQLDDGIEFAEMPLLYDDSWYWLHYRFFGCRDAICSETSSAVRTHLYNLAAYIYRSLESLPSKLGKTEEELLGIIAELADIAEYSRNFPIALWIYGDESSKSFLDEWLSGLPSTEQIEALFRLPHFQRFELERRPYMHNADKTALKRYRNEQAAFNKRRKESLRAKTRRGPPGK